MAATLKEKKGDVKDNLLSNKDLEELCKHINNRNRVRWSLYVSPCVFPHYPKEWDTDPDHNVWVPQQSITSLLWGFLT